MENSTKIGDNVSYVVSGDVLTLTISLKEKGTRSASGKSLVIASTRGNAVIEGGVTIGLNVFRKA